MSGIQWERQKRESDEAWQAFQLYLSLGEERSCLKVANQLSKAHALIRRWCSDWQWLERIRARDNWLVAEEDKAQKKKVRERTINRGKLYDNAFTAQAKYILYLVGKDPATLTAREADYLMKGADKLYQDHREMYALNAREQAQVDAQSDRFDLECLRLESAHSSPTPERDGSNFIDALEAAVPDVWSEPGAEPRKEDDDDGEDNSATGD